MKVSSMQVKQVGARLAAVALAGAAAFPASATTTAWWRFDDKAPGQQTASGEDWVVDSVSNVKAQPIMMAGETDNQFDSGTSAPRPVYIAPFATGFVYDPVTKERRANVAAMNFSAQPGRDAGGTKDLPAYYAAALRVGGAAEGQAEATQPTDAITVECFVRTTATGADFNGLAPIFAKRKGGGWTDESYALYMDGDGKMVARLNGTAYFNLDSNRKYRVNDGKWHHVALTYSASDKTVKVYVDYQLDREKATDGRSISYDESETANLHALWIGGTANWNASNGRRTFPGDIDELRISDTVLKPEEFLRIEAPDANVYRLTFDAAPANVAADAEGRPTLVKGLRVSDSLYIPGILDCSGTSAGSVAAHDATTKYADTLRDGLFSNAVANAGAIAFRTNGLAGGSYVAIPNFTRKFFGDTNQSFTAECFFRTRGEVRGDQALFQIGSIPTVRVFFKGDSPKRLSYIWNNNKAKAVHAGWRTDSPDDGQWHHVAFVYDDVRKQVRCYLDYRLDYQTCATNVMDNNSSMWIGCGRPNGIEQFFDGWIDDVRVTRAALLPEDFLCAHDVAVNPADPTRLFAAFDYNAETGPYPSFTGNWVTGLTGTGGAAPSYGGPRFACLLLGGEGTDARTPNHASLQLNGSAVAFPYARLYEQEAFTVEFFGKLSKVDGGANLIRYSSVDDADERSAPVWALYLNEEKAAKLQLSLNLIRDGKVVQNYTFRRYIPDLADRRWHHYALTFEPTQKDGQDHTRVVLYRDYRRVFSEDNPQDPDIEEFPGRLNLAVGVNGRLLLNSRAESGKQVEGRIDSLRFSKGVLPSERFIRKAKVGFLTVIR